MAAGPILKGAAAIIAAAMIVLVPAATGYPGALKPDQRAPGAVLFDDIRLVSMVPGAPDAQERRAVLVVGDRVEAIGPAGALTPPQGALVVDGAGRTLTPGLIDAHVHVWDEAELAGYLAHGVTGVRNMSGMPFHASLARRISARRILGPDFISTGPIINSAGPNQQDNHQLVETGEEARAAVRAQHAAGFRAIKIYANLKRAPYDAVIDEAKRLHMSVSGHTPEGVREEGMPDEKPFDIAFEDSLGRGLATIEHVESIVWHGLRDRLDEEAMRALAARIAQAGDAVTPTLIAHDNLVRVAASKGAYLDRPGTDTINPLLKFLEKDTYEHWSRQDPSWREGPRAVFYRRATKMLHDAGVPLVAGTDAGIFTNIPGSAMTRELELLVEAGLTPHEALATATRNGGEILGFEKTGIIAPGWRANLLLLDGDPLADVSALENPAGVMIGGRWIDEGGLRKMREGARQTSFIRSARRAVALLLSL